MKESSLRAVCALVGSDEVLKQVARELSEWDVWAWISKTGAVSIGVVVAACGVLVASKRLPHKWHYGLSALVAACVFAYGLLQPYEEYKQFRLAQYALNNAYLQYLSSEHGDQDLKTLIKAFDEARGLLREIWKQPSVQ
jgi:hypothetical protein